MKKLIARWSLMFGAAVMVVAPASSGAAAARKKAAKSAPAHASLHKGAGSKKGRGKHVLLERRVSAIKGGLPNVQALGALVVDETGHEIFSRHADKERPIASISKLAATLAVMDKGLELDGLTTITKDDIEVAKGGARSRLLEGTTVSNRDLLHAALMGSDNRAIPALGRAVKLSSSQLTAAMNSKARSLALRATRFREPTGLSSDNVSTPRETIAMLKAVMSHPVLGPITRRSEYDAHPVGRPPITYHNTDRPAQRSNVAVLSGKTGYNDDARYCLVIATKIEGRQVFMSFLGNEGKMTRFGDVARVADWLVSHKGKLPSSGTLTASATSPSGASGPSDGTSAGGASATAEVANATAPTAPPLPVGVAAPPPVNTTANP